jgi:hypothetical protein
VLLHCCICSGVRSRHYWFRLVSFPSSIALAVSSVFADRSGVVKLFVAGIVFFIHCVLTASLLPYVKWKTNFFYMCIGIASLVTKQATTTIKRKYQYNKYFDSSTTCIHQYMCLYQPSYTHVLICICLVYILMLYPHIDLFSLYICFY